MTIGERIKKLREANNMSQTELAERLNTSKQNLYKYENGVITNIPSDKIEMIARIYGVSPSYIMGWNEEPSNISDIITEDIYKIPVFQSVSAGFGSYASSEIIDYIPLVIKNPYEVPDTLAIVVKGDSMYPKIEDGDIVVVRKQDYVDSGSIAVVIKDNEDGLVKKIEYGKNHIELISINPMYPPQRFEREDMNRIRIVGLVKKIVKSL